jgi:hypothetical protein
MINMLTIFFSPGDAFRKLREKPNWIAPLIVVLIFGIAVSIVAVSKVDVRAKAEEAMRQQGLTEEQVQQRMEQAGPFMNSPVLKYGGPVFSVLFITVAALLVSALVLNWIVAMLGVPQGNFMLAFSVVSWAALVRVVASIVRGILVFLRGPEHLSTGLSLLVPGVKAGFGYAFLNGVDVFSIWEVILVAMGLKIAFDLKGRSAYLYVLLLWLLSVAVFSLFALLPGPGARMG